MASRPSRRVRDAVLTRSGDRRAMPDCRRLPVVPGTSRDPAKLSAKVAHMAGNRPGLLRCDSDMSDEERNSEDNLVAVCANCHDKIDGQPNAHAVFSLRKIKAAHEAWVMDELGRSMPKVYFPELEQAVRHAVASDCGTSKPDTPLPPREKIDKNHLSSRSENMIRHGMMATRLVKEYLDASTDGQLAGRLKSGLGREYDKNRGEGLEGDELFDSMLRFVGGTGDFARDAAGLAILVHFFESCEVFEK